MRTEARCDRSGSGFVFSGLHYLGAREQIPAWRIGAVQRFARITSSCFRSPLSMTNGPKGNNAAIRTVPVRRASHIASWRACVRAMQKAMNNMPCSQPATVTACGIPAKYLSGIAIPNKTRKETPSTIPTARSRPIEVLNIVILVTLSMAPTLANVAAGDFALKHRSHGGQDGASTNFAACHLSRIACAPFVDGFIASSWPGIFAVSSMT